MDNGQNKILRSKFKEQHFGADTDLGPLFAMYQASNAFYKNTTNKGSRIKFPGDVINDKLGLSSEALEFYDVYEHEILNKVKEDKPFMPLIEVKVCSDLIEMEYMLNSEGFNTAFQNFDNALFKRVKKVKRDHAKEGLPNYLPTSQIGCGEACFVLYLHPEFVDTVTCMMRNFVLPQPVAETLKKVQKFQQYMLENQMNAQRLAG